MFTFKMITLSQDLYRHSKQNIPPTSINVIKCALRCTKCATRNKHKFVCVQYVCMECVVTIWCRMQVRFLNCSGVVLLESLWAIQ